jgi:hypothetical protein
MHELEKALVGIFARTGGILLGLGKLKGDEYGGEHPGVQGLAAFFLACFHRH